MSSPAPTCDSTTAATVDGADDGDRSPVVALLVGLVALGAVAAVITVDRRRRSSPTQR